MFGLILNYSRHKKNSSEMQKIGTKVTPIVVSVFELPELVCVETKYITRQYAIDNKIQVGKKTAHEPPIYLNPAPPDDNDEDTSQKSMPKFTKLDDRGTMTADVSMPSRGRSMQTEPKATAEIGVQCQRDASEERELFFNDVVDSPKSSTELAAEENKFLSYVSQHTGMFGNGMLECLLCGEVAKSLKEQQSHLALHYGPPALCWNCGKLVSHEFLLRQHHYNCPERPNARSRPKMYIQCPHLRCNAMITSKQHLNKHLLKHVGVQSYHCLQCRNSFDSSTHFLAHRLLEPACSKAKLIYLDNKYGKRTKATLRRCTVCMKSFSNVRRCVWHKRQCILRHHKRLQSLLASSYKVKT